MSGGHAELERALAELCSQADAAIERGVTVLILSDRGVDSERAPIPASTGRVKPRFSCNTGLIGAFLAGCHTHDGCIQAWRFPRD